MRKFKTLVGWIARNPYLHLFLGLVVLLTGLWETWDSLDEDLVTGHLQGHHGVAFLGLWHTLRSFAEIIESFDYLQEGVAE